jgi:predicted DNA-binding transcriptional regulator YafY
MPISKNAYLRYKTLDNCFRNTRRKYSIDDLVDACNKALEEAFSETGGVKKRQVYSDIEYMESDAGYSVELKKEKVGRNVYYRYVDPKYSILSAPIKEEELNQLKESIDLLSRFKGLPQFDWVEDISIKLESLTTKNNSSQSIVGFEQNPYLKGLEFFKPLFDSIIQKAVLEIEYKSFKSVESTRMIIHPYYLKQYNNRWFLFGLNMQWNRISNISLDRIEGIIEINDKYIPSDIDFDEYFDDVIGVTIANEAIVQQVVLYVSNSLTPYILTKPIHGSQKIEVEEDGSSMVRLNLIINFELERLLFSFGPSIKVIEPESLALEMQNQAKKLLEEYN